MKKVSILFLFLLLGIVFRGVSQTTAPTDFFAGKWEITVVGLPDGDAKFATNLVRKEGKLTGELKDASGKRPEAVPVTRVDEEANKVTIYFNTDQAGEIGIELAKVDDDHLKGQLMSMFDATAARVK